MAERGIDISQQQPKDVGSYLGKLSVRTLFVVCHDAEEQCPRIFPGMMSRVFWPIDDPASFAGSSDETLGRFRMVRDELEERITEWLSKNP
jgi:arsenate reductase (thioredoxin)